MDINRGWQNGLITISEKHGKATSSLLSHKKLLQQLQKLKTQHLRKPETL